jgi:uncharacterized protein YebE (UPF0316 family)
VFLAETGVVTLSTIRTIFIARGMRVRAALLGFFEVSIWLFAIGQIMQNLTRPECYVAFAAGFALGNYLGVSIERRIALGDVVVRVITGKDPSGLIESLRAVGYGVTCLSAEGANGPVKMVFTVIKRKELEQAVALIKGFDPQTFYSVDDLQSAQAGIFPAAKAPAGCGWSLIPRRIFSWAGATRTLSMVRLLVLSDRTHETRPGKSTAGNGRLVNCPDTWNSHTG